MRKRFIILTVCLIISTIYYLVPPKDRITLEIKRSFHSLIIVDVTHDKNGTYIDIEDEKTRSHKRIVKAPEMWTDLLQRTSGLVVYLPQKSNDNIIMKDGSVWKFTITTENDKVSLEFRNPFYKETILERVPIVETLKFYLEVSDLRIPEDELY